MADKSATTTHDTAAVSAPKELSPSVSVMANPIQRLQRTAGNRAVSAVLADRGEGAPLPDGMRSTFEPLFARSFADVRIHSGPRAADLVRGVGARAFTRGSDIYLGENADHPSTIAHELAHTVQQSGASPQSRVSARGDRDEGEARDAASRVLAGLPAHVASGTAESAVQRDEPAPEGYELTDDPDHPLKPIDAPEHDEDALPGEEPLTFPVAVSEKRPELVIVPEEATRRDIARVLLGDETRDGEFDFFVPPEGGRAVRLRNPDLLVTEGKTLMREKLDAVMDTDVARVAEILGYTWIDDANEWELAESVLRWSQRSTIHTEDGATYFDEYLDRLRATPIGDDSNALVEIIDETENKSEQVLKAINLRGVNWSTSYEVTDTRPVFAPGDVVGRFYFSTGSGVQLKVVEQLAAEPTLARAELILRNTRTGGLRVVIPGSDGVFYGYLLIDTTIRDPLIPLPQDDPAGNYYWYYPGTVAVLPGQFEADAPKAGEDTVDLRRSLLDDALSLNELRPLLDLDFSVITTATVDERVSMMTLAMSGDVGERSAGFIARVLYTTPDAEYPILERRLDAAGLMERLVIAARSNGSLAVVGRIFTVKAITALPLGGESLADMPSFTVGYDEEGKYHLAMATEKTVASQLIAANEWDPRSSVRVGHEPAAPDEAPGPIQRQAIVFEPGTVRGGLGNAVLGTFQIIRHLEASGPPSRPLLPTELVQIHEIGPQPRTVIVSALEAAGLLRLRMDVVFRNVIQPVADMTLLATGGLGLVRAFGPALSGGLATGGLRAGLTALGEAAATQTGKAALRSALITGVLIGGNRVIDAYREELEQSPEGRALIAAWNVAMLALLAKDVYAIAKSGIIGEIGKLASRTYATLSGAAARRLRNAVDDLRALELASQRFIEAEKKMPALAVAGGGTATMGAEAPEFGALLMAARAEVRSATLVTTLREAGASTTVAERVFKRLQTLSDASKEMARAQKAIASHASTLAKNPAALDDFLIAVENAVAARGNTAGRLAGFLQAATKAPNPIAYLDDVRWLLSRNGVSADAIETLGNRAAKGQLDLGWLKTTSLTDRDLSYLGADSLTPWNIFQKVANGTATKGEFLWAQRSIRGIAAELTARRGATTYFPGNRISATQYPTGGSKIDFVLTSTDGLAVRRGLEVKGFTPETWKDVLAAWEQRAAGASLTAEQAELADRVDRMLRQLQNAESALGNKPVLAISDKIRGADETILRSVLSRRVPGTQVVKMSDADIVSMGNDLRTAVGIPVP